MTVSQTAQRRQLTFQRLEVDLGLEYDLEFEFENAIEYDLEFENAIEYDLEFENAIESEPPVYRSVATTT